MTTLVIGIAYYAVLSLGLLALLSLTTWLWYFAINKLYMRNKATYQFLEYFIHRKAFKKWYKENKKEKVTTPKLEEVERKRRL